MRFSLQIEPSQGVTWAQQLALARHAEEGGFETLYRSDHYESLPGPAGRPTTDAWATIAGSVLVTERLRHGTLVSPVTFRHPANTAKVVATVDEMSGGRVELGLGAGWHLNEHRRHGLLFPDLETRLEMLEEQLQVVAGLWSGQRGWSFEGVHYQVEDAWYAPPPVQRPRLPLIVGTQGRPRAIRIAARYADHLNLYYCTPAMAQSAFELLDDECRIARRDPGDVTRSVLLGTIVGNDAREAARRMEQIMDTFEFRGSPEEWQRENEGLWITGLAADARRIVDAYADAGVELIVFQDFLPQDLDLVDLLGELAHKWSATTRSR